MAPSKFITQVALALIPHLVLDRAAADAVAFTQAAVGIDVELGYQKQRNPFGAGRCVGQTRQYHVNDILGHIVLAGGDKDLGSGDVIATVIVWLGLGSQ